MDWQDKGGQLDWLDWGLQSLIGQIQTSKSNEKEIGLEETLYR